MSWFLHFPRIKFILRSLERYHQGKKLFMSQSGKSQLCILKGIGARPLCATSPFVLLPFSRCRSMGVQRQALEPFWFSGTILCCTAQLLSEEESACGEGSKGAQETVAAVYSHFSNICNLAITALCLSWTDTQLSLHKKESSSDRFRGPLNVQTELKLLVDSGHFQSAHVLEKFW